MPRRTIDRYTLDASDWPLIINDGETPIMLFSDPGDDVTHLTREHYSTRSVVLRVANAAVRCLNQES